MPAKQKYVYFFGSGKAEGKCSDRKTLGGKGAGLAEMTNIGLPVPAGFTITVDACEYYDAHGKQWPKGLDTEIRQQLAKLEKSVGKKLGDPQNPLLVSVRSGAARSMPGMMETILNLGLNDKSVAGLAAEEQVGERGELVHRQRLRRAVRAGHVEAFHPPPDAGRGRQDLQGQARVLLHADDPPRALRHRRRPAG